MVTESSKTKGIKLGDEKTIRKFELVKEFLGLENDSEVVRYLISDFIRRNRLYENRRNGNTSFIDADADAEVFSGSDTE